MLPDQAYYFVLIRNPPQDAVVGRQLRVAALGGLASIVFEPELIEKEPTHLLRAAELNARAGKFFDLFRQFFAARLKHANVRIILRDKYWRL